MTLGPGPVTLTQAPTHTTATGTGLPFPAVAPTPAKNPAKTTRIETIVVALIAVFALGAGVWARLFVALQARASAASTKSTRKPDNDAYGATAGDDEQAQSQPPPATPSAKTPASGTPPAASPNSAPAKPAPGKPSAPAATPAPAIPASTPAATPASPPATPAKAPVAFDPRKLDANTNAKLKIEIAKFPNGIPFSVEMNGKPYTHFITGDGDSLDNLFVPPGVQQFRVVMKSGGQEWDSNVLNDEFKAKKRQVLKIQLTQKGKVVGKIALPISKDDDPVSVRLNKLRG